MKKIFLILAGITISLVSCKKDNDDSNSPKVSVTFKPLVTETKKLKNVKLGEHIELEFTITDLEDNTGKEVEYIKPQTIESSAYYNNPVKDYEMLAYVGEGQKAPKVDILTYAITYYKADTYKVYIIPKKAGSYEIPFSFYKRVDGNKDKEKDITVLPYEFRFDVAKVKAWTKVEQQGNRFRNVFYFRFEDGGAPNMNFLSSSKWHKQEYFLHFNGQNLSGEFDQGKDIQFFASEWKNGSAPEILYRKIDRIHITQENGPRPYNWSDCYDLEW